MQLVQLLFWVATLALGATTSVSAAALPSLPRYLAAPYEPLFRRASHPGGPSQSVATLRARARRAATELQRSLRSTGTKTTAARATNPKHLFTASNATAQHTTIVTVNPKARRSLGNPAPMSMVNPKLVRRAPASPLVNPKSPALLVRSLLANTSNATSAHHRAHSINPKAQSVPRSLHHLVNLKKLARRALPVFRNPRYYTPTPDILAKIAIYNLNVAPLTNPKLDACLEWEYWTIAPATTATPLAGTAGTVPAMAHTATVTGYPGAASSGAASAAPSSTSPPAPAATAGVTWPAQKNLIAAGYYPDWYGTLPMDFARFDLLDFGTSSPSLTLGLVQRMRLMLTSWSSQPLPFPTKTSTFPLMRRLLFCSLNLLLRPTPPTPKSCSPLEVGPEVVSLVVQWPALATDKSLSTTFSPSFNKLE